MMPGHPDNHHFICKHPVCGERLWENGVKNFHIQELGVTLNIKNLVAKSGNELASFNIYLISKQNRENDEVCKGF